MKSLIQFIHEHEISLKTNIKESQLEVNGFAILKPGFDQYYNDWKNLLQNKKWDIVRCNKIRLTGDQAEDLYLPHKEKDFYNDLCDYMCSGDCYCAICHKDCEDPIKDMSMIKEEVRKNWGIDDMKNAMHSSDSLENVDRESKICLK